MCCCSYCCCCCPLLLLLLSVVAVVAVRCCCCCCPLLLSVVAVAVVVVVAQKQQALTPWANKVTTLQYAHSSPSKQYRFLACTDTWQRYVKVRTESEHGEMEEVIDSSRMFTVFSCCCCSCWLFDVAWF